MVVINALKPGDVVYETRKVRAGNTTMSRFSTWRITIKEVDPDGAFVIASWNGNTPKKYHEMSVRKWRRMRPDRS